MFAKINLDEGKVAYDYTKTFKILAEVVEETNDSKMDEIESFDGKILEPEKRRMFLGQTGDLLPLRLTWLYIAEGVRNCSVKVEV